MTVTTVTTAPATATTKIQDLRNTELLALARQGDDSAWAEVVAGTAGWSRRWCAPTGCRTPTPRTPSSAPGCAWWSTSARARPRAARRLAGDHRDAGVPGDPAGGPRPWWASRLDAVPDPDGDVEERVIDADRPRPALADRGRAAAPGPGGRARAVRGRAAPVRRGGPGHGHPDGQPRPEPRPALRPLRRSFDDGTDATGARDGPGSRSSACAAPRGSTGGTATWPAPGCARRSWRRSG